MLIPFHSKASGDFFMFDHHVKVLFNLMDLPFNNQGIIEAKDTGLYVHRLKTNLTLLDEPAQTTPDDDDTEHSAQLQAQSVGLKQRAWPLIDMLERAQQKNVAVIWGNTV